MTDPLKNKTVQSSTRLRRIGNSTGVTIPKDLLDKAGLAEGTEVEIQAGSDRLVIGKKSGTDTDARRTLHRSFARYDRAYRKLAQ